MTVNELVSLLNLEVLAGTDALNNKITGGYCGDLLSWVMGRASEGDAWITVMGNLNAIAVGVLADVSCILLADSSVLDDDAKNRADGQGLPVLRSSMDSYSLCKGLSKCLGNQNSSNTGGDSH